MKRTALVADDHELMRVALGNILTGSLGFDGVEAVESFGDAIEAIERNPRIELILLDLTMPGMDGARSLVEVRTKRPEARIAVVSGSVDRGDMMGALQAGMNGYVPKSLTITELTEALQRISNGQVYLPPSFASIPDPNPVPAAVVPGRKLAAVAAAVDLTPRQRSVLEEIRKGHTNREIAQNLDLAEGTVKSHLAALFKALGVRNRSEAAVAASEMSAS